MTPLAADLQILFRRDLRCLIREIDLFPDDTILWQTLPGISNSAGNLTLHVAGNLRHFVGSVLGHTDYRRDREAEFAQRECSRASLVAALERTLSEVETGLNALSPEALDAPYPQSLKGHQPVTRLFLMHLAIHLAFHLGQVGYLRRALTGEASSSGGMAIEALFT